MNLSFMGAARTVTGSRHLLHVNGKNILLDCGMFQDKISIKADRNIHFGFDPRSIDFVILSHAHIDHSGCLPRLVKDGFRGTIFSTPATYELCKVMLADSAHIQENDTKRANEKRRKEGKAPRQPIYTQDDVEETMPLFISVPFGEDYKVADGIHFSYTDVGHIIGSAATNLTLTENNKTVRLAFTGDIGRYNDLILKEPQPFPQADYILCESTYGDRLHETSDDAALELLEIVRHTCLEKKRKADHSRIQSRPHAGNRVLARPHAHKSFASENSGVCRQPAFHERNGYYAQASRKLQPGHTAIHEN